MEEKETPILRYGGHLILLVVAIAIIIGWRASLASGAVEPPVQTTRSAEAPATGGALVEGSPAVEEVEPLALASLGQLPIISELGIEPNPNPHTFQGASPEHSFETYLVKRGDTPGGIAEQFGIRTETLLGGNPQLGHESSLLQTGVTLVILPVDGVLHDVEPGDTLENVSELYGIPAEEIIAYAPNNLEFPYRLYPDTQIMVPGAVREVFVWTPPDLSSVNRGTSFEGSGVAPIVVGTGTFVYPVGYRVFTQFFWYGHQAIDIALPEGSAVYASDTGTVTYAGWNNYGYGYLVVVNHGNGFETFYAHLSGYNVSPGQIVYQGNLIAQSGNTGNSSGPHIHFEIRRNNNRDDPCWYIGC